MFANVSDEACKPKLKTVFQGHNSFIFLGLTSENIEFIKVNDCSEYHDVFQGIDEVYSMLTSDVQDLVYAARLAFLNAEALKSGYACTYGVDSYQWFVQNLGQSSTYFLYADIIRLNANFDGYETIALFTMTQTLDLIISSNLFTSVSSQDEQRVSAVINFLKTKDYTYVQGFMIQLRKFLIQINIKIVININVRFQFLQGVFGILKDTKRFSTFTSNDWYTWFHEYLIFFTASITTDQLSVLTNDVVEDCNNMQTIVRGLNNVFDDMNDGSKSNITNWIIGFLRNKPDGCDTGNVKWLKINFESFSPFVPYPVVIELNPSIIVIDVLTDLSPAQIGQAITVVESAHYNVTLINIVFEALTSGTNPVDDLASFWQSFNQEAPEMDQYTVEVKETLLTETVNVISAEFDTFEASDWTEWFGVNLVSVTTVINNETLSKFPLTADCNSYKAFTKSLSGVYDETLDTSKTFVFDFIDTYLTKGPQCTEAEVSTVSFLEDYMANYSVDASYKQFTVYYSAFNPLEDGVFQILTDTQLGDMFVVSNIYESIESTTTVFTYLQTLSVESVTTVVTEFNSMAVKEDITISETVGQYILESYLSVIETSLVSYTDIQITEFFENTVFSFTQFFTVQDLEMLPVEDCGRLNLIVTQLNTGFSKMSEDTRSAIAGWILDLLKSSKLNGCSSNVSTSKEYIQYSWQSFFEYVSLKEVKEVYAALDVISIINSTSISQKVEFLFSSTEILQSVETTTIVLESMVGSDNEVTVSEIYTFTDEFNAAYSTLNVQTMTTEVQQEFMTFFFSYLVSDLNTMTTVQISQFESEFQYFLSGITVESIQIIPLTMNCETYSSIFSAFNSVFNKLSDSVAKSIFDRLLSYLQAQYDGSSDICPSLYTTSLTYVQNIFFSFVEYAEVYQIEIYYSKFDVYEVLSLLSGKQLGGLLINSTAITDELEAVPILIEIKKRDNDEVISFLTECATVAAELNIVTLPNTNIENLIVQTVWPVVSETLSTLSPEESKSLFEETLPIILPSVPASAIENMPPSKDCDSQKAFVAGFGKVFDEMSVAQQEAVYGKIRKFNKDVKENTGSACETPSGTSEEYFNTFFGPCGKLADIADILEDNPNFNPASALSVFDGTQLAEFAISTQALTSEESINTVFENIATTKEVQDFLVQLNEAAPDKLQNSPYADVILTNTIEIISEDFSTFTVESWTVWTQEILVNILYTVNETELNKIPLPLSCDSYQAVLTGLDNVYDKMTEKSRKSVYDNFIVPQLDKTTPQDGVRCGKKTDKTPEWSDKNLGQFLPYAEITVLETWNTYYQSTDVISSLSPTQLAEVAVQSVNDEEVACQVAGRIQKFEADDADSFLDTFYTSLKASNVKITSTQISYKFLSASITAISSSLSTYSVSDWENLFSTRLQPFLLSFDAPQLTTILNSCNCDAYGVVVKYLSDAFDSFSADTQQSLFGSLQGFLKKQPSGSGVCPKDGENSAATTNRLFGKFLKYENIDYLYTYMNNFDGLSAINLLSSEQKANLAFTGDILTNAESAQILTNSISDFSSGQLDSFLSTFQNTAQQKGISSLPNAGIQASLFNAIYGVASKQFSLFSTEQWNSYFTFKFNFFLSSITEAHIALIPSNINCNSYQSIVSGISSVYNSLSEPVQVAIYQWQKAYLTANKPIYGPACPVGSGNSGKWLEYNFGLSGEHSSKEDILFLFPEFSFTQAVYQLTATQLGYFVANNEVLSDKDAVAKVFTGINSVNIGEFLDAFNAGIAKYSITQITNVVVKQFFLGEIFCDLGSLFSSFSVNDYVNWFQTKLSFFLSSINAKALGFISTSISCDSLAAITQPLIQLQNPENPGDIYNFIKSVLAAQKASTGHACTAGLSSREWIEKYFGKIFIVYSSWQDITSLFANFQAAECTEFLPPSILAAASASSLSSSSYSEITTMLLSFNGTLDDFLDFMDNLQTFALKNPSLLSNPKIRDTLLMVVANSVFANLDQFDLTLTQKWISTINFLLPSINGTMLQSIPMSCSCAQYQILVKGLSDVFVSLTTAKKQEVGDFIKQFLTSKLSEAQRPDTLWEEFTMVAAPQFKVYHV
ncbi:uncharacterized protein LOC142217109 [Leptodactylus fuscus]|uniref:uncharacterized protein LOC142217109 n=1 Tax=Leptodactylus fuscus TaxID=238119 RepID=UPI003F4F1835